MQKYYVAFKHVLAGKLVDKLQGRRFYTHIAHSAAANIWEIFNYFGTVKKFHVNLNIKQADKKPDKQAPHKKV